MIVTCSEETKWEQRRDWIPVNAAVLIAAAVLLTCGKTSLTSLLSC